MSKVASLAEIRTKQVNNVKFKEVEAHGTTIRIGSVSSAAMLEWVEGNKDESKKKIAGLRLLAKSLTDETGERYPEDQLEAVVKDLSEKDAQDNGKIIREVLQLNGFPVPKDPNVKPEEGKQPELANPEAGMAARKND